MDSFPFVARLIGLMPMCGFVRVPQTHACPVAQWRLSYYFAMVWQKISVFA